MVTKKVKNFFMDSPWGIRPEAVKAAASLNQVRVLYVLDLISETAACGGRTRIPLFLRAKTHLLLSSAVR
jgi:hypothetical protein